jgi:hypothetical protein
MRRVQTGISIVLVLLGAVVADAQQLRQAWVRVADSTGAPITGLSANKFTVIEDGVNCRTLKADPIEWPTRITVLVDNGGKSSDYLSNLRNGLYGLIKEMPSDVEMSLLTLAPQPRWVVRPTKDPQQLARGVGLITPDAGSGKFFDGLLEAADRAAKDNGSFFPVFVMAVSMFGNSDPPLENQYQRMQKELIDRAATVHFVLLSVSSESGAQVTGAFQTNVGNRVATLTGGRYENISAASRLDTWLPEIGKRIAQSAAKQKYEYRLIYESPKGAKEPKTIGVDVAINGATIDLSADGHLP